MTTTSALRLSDKTAVGGGGGAVSSHRPCERGLFNIVLGNLIIESRKVGMAADGCERPDLPGLAAAAELHKLAVRGAILT